MGAYQLIPRLVFFVPLLFCISCGQDVYIRDDGGKLGYFQLVSSGECHVLPLDRPDIDRKVQKGQIVRLSQKDYLACKSAMNLKESIDDAANATREAAEQK